MDFYSVICLGHTLKQPLIGPSSELVDRLEPHALFTPGLPHRAAVPGCTVLVGRGGGVPGVVQAGWVWEGTIPGTHPP